jgi:hypothetical protein
MTPKAERRRIYRALERIPEEWEAKLAVTDTRDVLIRWRTPEGHCHCPITAACEVLTGKRVDVQRFQWAASLFRVSRETASQVALTADEENEAPEYSPHIRRALLGE